MLLRRCVRPIASIARSLHSRAELLQCDSTCDGGGVFVRHFHASRRLAAVRPFILSDPGEGIKEVQIIQWFVEPGARVEQFDKIVEVQTDKASNEITSRFDGVIKKLRWEKDDVVQVGQALLDIDVQSEVSQEDEKLLGGEPAQAESKPSEPQPPLSSEDTQGEAESTSVQRNPKGSHGVLATPAVRGLLKELNVNIEDVQGTGKDGRVMKEDVQAFASAREANQDSKVNPPFQRRKVTQDEGQKEQSAALTPIQNQMFKTMTKSLSIPHFLYADEIDVTALSNLRQSLNSKSSNGPKLSYLPFILKAVSLALEEWPLLNARIEHPTAATQQQQQQQQQPKLVMREKHNIGVAMDTSQGLLVPNIKNVAALSILDIAADLSLFQSLAAAAKFTSKDLSGGTITVSNIGSIGGTYVSPIIASQDEVAILGLGKARTVPAFDAKGENVVKKTVMNFSWSADHRVVDGATMARMAETVRRFVEDPALMIARLR